MTESRHLIFGAGLIGGFLAGGLINAKLPTNLVAREKTQAAMANGLLISDYNGEEVSLRPPNFICSAKTEETTFDFIWLTVKCTSVAGISEQLQPFVNESTVIICCQNGLGSDQIIRQSFPNNDVLIAIVGFNVSEPNPGHLHRSTEGRLVIEHATPKHSIAREVTTNLISALNCEILPTVGSDQIEAEQWAKLQLNLTNPINALANIPLKQMLEDRGYRRIVASLMEELLFYCDTKGIELPQINAVPGRWIPRIMRLPNFVFNIVGKNMIDIDPTARLSMWWDLHNRRHTEISFINGALVDACEELDIACNANRAVVQLIRQVEKSGEELTLSSQELVAYIHSSSS